MAAYPSNEDDRRSLSHSFDHSLADQLPYLLERVPPVNVASELIEIPSNAPSSLPCPPLFPGEVLRMRQHRVVCTDSFSEPLLGVVYLTNFRIIFNGLPIKSPELYEVLKEMQFTGASNNASSKETGEFSNRVAGSGSGGVSSGGTFRSFRRKKFSNPPRATSNFYTNSTNGVDSTDGGGTSDQSDSLHSKVIKKISSLARSNDNNAQLKSDHHTLKSNTLSDAKRSSKPLAISLPIVHQDVVSASVPNMISEKPLIVEDKSVTLPRPMPCHQEQGVNPTDQYDSGFIDPLVLSKPASVEGELNDNSSTPAGTSETVPVVPDSSLFVMSTEVDFEKSVDMDEVLLRTNNRRTHPRPDSILAVDSDSDSDSASDRYFSSIVEDDFSSAEGTTSPDYPLSPPPEGLNRFVDPSQPVCPVKPPIKPRPPRTLTRHSLQSNESHPLSNESAHVPDPVNPSPDPVNPSSDPLPTAHVPDPLTKPCKPPRRKNKFQKKDSSDSLGSKDDSSGGSSPLTPDPNPPVPDPTPPVLGPTPPVLGPTPPVLDPLPCISDPIPPVSDPIPPVSDPIPPVPDPIPPVPDPIPPLIQTRQPSLRRVPPPPPNTVSQAQPTIKIDPTSQPRDAHPLAVSPEGMNDESYRISQSSMIPNCPSNASLMKRFTLSTLGNEGVIERYSSFGWSQSGESMVKRAVCNTWSDSRITAKSMPYIHYTHTASIPLRSLKTIKQLPSLYISDVGLKLPDGVVLVSNGFSSLKLFLHPSNTFDSSKLKELLENTLAYHQPIYSCFAFKYRSAIKMPNPNFFDSRKYENFYSFDAELKRVGILNTKVDNTQIWRVTSVTKDHPELCRSYPDKLVVLLCTPDVDLIRGASVYQEGRFPTACWMDRTTESVLLRGAATTSERGQHGSKLPVDEAILHAIRKCNKHGQLFVFTERAEQGGFQDPTKLTADAARSYFYHNCHFTYSINPPTFKSIRHSFNKLQAMMLNNTPDEEYLMVLDNTRWLSRVSELLDTACKVSRALTQDKGHVLVCYESGWDRTTQVVSLAQLLCDPYYRTMNGFQVLIQKEWVWFGHPFGLRNGHMKSKVKTEGPVFLQWLDCVYQVLRQFPLAFEFNESLLMAILDQSYSDQFGTFLVNSEKERQQRFMVPDHYHQSVNANTVSIWSWVSLMNSSNTVFYNTLYDKEFHPGVIYPKYHVTCLELWRSCYERDKVRMELQDSGYDVLRSDINQLLSLYYDRNDTKRDDPLLLAIGSCSPTHGSSISLRDELGPSPVPAPVYGKPLSKPKSDKTYTNIHEYLKAEGLDASVCHHITISDSICQGYLVKEGGVMKTWKKRWFVLDYHNAYFAYFESEEHFTRNDNPKGVIPLIQIQRVSLTSKREHLMYNLFQVKTPSRTYSMKAPSIVSMYIWIACLKLSPSALKKD